MPTVSINIADRGTKTVDSEGNEDTSTVGHMWYSLKKDDESPEASYGFAPDDEHESHPFAPGSVHRNDNTHYQEPRYYTRTVEISEDQYDAMKDFGDNPKKSGFSTYYNGLSNSCIDFTWKAMEMGGLNPEGYEGKLWPTWNVSKVDKALDAFEKKSAPSASGQPAARINDMHVCPMVTGVVPHVGGPILPPGAVTVLIGSLPTARVGDMATCVGPPDVIAKGSATVLIAGMPAARMGDMTAHGGTIVLGCPTVLIGG